MWVNLSVNRRRLSLTREVYHMLLASLKTSEISRSMKVTFAKALSIFAEDPTSKISVLDRLKVLLSFQSIGQFKQLDSSDQNSNNQPLPFNSNSRNFQEFGAQPGQDNFVMEKRNEHGSYNIQKSLQKVEQDIHYSIDKIASHLRLRILLIQLLSIQTFDLYRTKLYQYYPSELLDNWEN